ncbi:MAG: type IV toxin-antitoxin system AbiEi family antitoxin domain-containing protein [Amnibacterium sp.]
MTSLGPELITVRAAERAGITRRSLARAAEKGELVHVRRGVYVPTALWAPLDGRQRHLVRLRALMEVADRPMVVSHWSAALLHELPVPRSRLLLPEVTVPLGTGRSITGARARADAVPAAQVALIAGLPVTDLARTALDIAETGSFAEGVTVLDEVLHRTDPSRRETARGALLTLWEERPRRRATARVPEVIAFADGDNESPGESVSRVTMRAIGLPRPVLQHEFRDRDGFAGRADFWFPDEDFIGEMDGQGKYLDPTKNGGDAAKAVIGEKRREDRLRRLVKGFARWGWTEARSPLLLARRLGAVGVLPTR